MVIGAVPDPGDQPILNLLAYYRALFAAYGPQGWWPARTRFEVIVGAILTQNTSWKNVEAGIAALRRATLLDPRRMRLVRRERLARIIRATGYFNQKAGKLLAFLAFLERHHGGRLARMLRQEVPEQRRQLLEISGIGPETADSIILYAAGKRSFVVDAYTRRLLERHGLLDGSESYDAVQRMFASALPADASIYKEYHALIVRVGKEHCRKPAPLCDRCPLEPYLPAGGVIMPPQRHPKSRTRRSNLPRPGQAPAD